MTRAVLYAHDMEPITVIDLGPWPMEFLLVNRHVRIPVMEPIFYDAWRSPSPNDTVPMRVVEITAEVMSHKGQRHLMLFTKDEESALLLESVFLPGQRKELQQAERDAAARGAADMAALISRRLGGLP